MRRAREPWEINGIGPQSFFGKDFAGQLLR